MYVVSINDCGEETNFLATLIYFAGSQLNATIPSIDPHRDGRHVCGRLVVGANRTKATLPELIYLDGRCRKSATTANR